MVRAAHRPQDGHRVLARQPLPGRRASLARCVVELVFDPFDLTDIDVRHKGKPAGKAVPFIIGRHRHAKTRTGDHEQRAEPEPTGIDYLKILDQAYGQDLQAQINYAALIADARDGGCPGAEKAGDGASQEDSHG